MAKATKGWPDTPERGLEVWVSGTGWHTLRAPFKPNEEQGWWAVRHKSGVTHPIHPGNVTKWRRADG